MKMPLLIISIGCALVATAQKVELPTASRISFQKAHPTASNSKVEKENENYEISFKEDRKSMSVLIDSKGGILETEQDIKLDELPLSIQNYMKEHYKNKMIKEAAKITKSDGAVNYEAAIKGIDIIFNANGKFIKESKN